MTTTTGLIMSDSHDAFFVAEHDYSSADASQLSFKAGQVIKIHEYSEDWWLGSLAHLSSGTPGWFSPSFGRVSAAYSSAYAGIGDEDRALWRAQALKKIISDEIEFVTTLKEFLDLIIVPLSKRDTQFKPLETCSNAAAVADVVTQYAPSLDMFATLTVEIPSFVNDLKVHLSALEVYKKEENSFADAKYILAAANAPLNHFEGYLSNFGEYTKAHVTVFNTGDQPAVAKAFEAIKAGVSKINQKKREREQRESLLILQNQFQGNAVIYTPSRLLIVRGKVEKVQKKDGTFKSKEYFMHLFNDSLIYSVYNKMSDTFKIHKSIDLTGTIIQVFKDEDAVKHFNGYTNVFVIFKANDDKKSDVFRCATPEKAKIWSSHIKDVISKLNDMSVKLATKRSSMSNIDISGVTLGARMKLVKDYLLQEISVAQAIKLMQSSFARSMSDCCKGGPLIVTMPEEILSETPDIKYNTETATKAQKEAMTELLLDADVQIFLRAMDTLSGTLQDFIKSVQENCERKKWAEGICIGDYFTSVTAKTLLSNYKSYSTGQQATNRIMKNAVFRSFYKDADRALSMFPGTLGDKIEGIRNRPKACLTFLQNLLAMTPTDHPDNTALIKAVDTMKPLVKAVEDIISSKINFEKLLSIQASIVGTTGGGFFHSKDPIIERLASTDRTFVKEGDLKKVCRKVNKTFRFWLFNDCLMYGKLQGNSTYIFHRNIFLKDCTVKAYTGDDMLNAFEVHGAEKSFIILCNSIQQQGEWLRKLLELTPKESKVQAPIWKPDAPSQTCCVCKSKFGIFRRAHHCRKCGLHCCDEHSKAREIIEHISRTEKQRFCDNCSKINTTFETARMTSAASAVPAAPQAAATASLNPFDNGASQKTAAAAAAANPFEELSETERAAVRRKSLVQELVETVERTSIAAALQGADVSSPPPSRVTSATKRGAPPPPPPVVLLSRPPPPAIDDIEVDAPEEPENPLLAEFRQKLKFKIPPIAVKQAMSAKGFGDAEIQKFFEAEGIFDSSLFASAMPAPRPPPPRAAQVTGAPAKPSFLGDISGGISGLKKVAPPPPKEIVVENKPAAGSFFAEMIAKREKLKAVDVEAASDRKVATDADNPWAQFIVDHHPNHPHSDESDNDGSEHDSDSDSDSEWH